MFNLKPMVTGIVITILSITSAIAHENVQFTFICNKASEGICMLGVDTSLGTDPLYAINAVGADSHQKASINIKAMHFSDYNAARVAAGLGITAGAIGIVAGGYILASGGVYVGSTAGFATRFAYIGTQVAKTMMLAGAATAIAGVAPAFTVSKPAGGVYLVNGTTGKAATNLDASCKSVFYKKPFMLGGQDYLENGHPYEMYLLPHGKVISVTVTATADGGYKNCALYD